MKRKIVRTEIYMRGAKMANENKNLPKRDFSEKWENLTFANNFIFYKVLRHNPEACKHIIEMLLDIKIEKMEIGLSNTFL